MQTVEQQLEEMRCTFKADTSEACEKCRSIIPKGSDVFWISDGGMEPQDGTYLCENCARKLCR